MQILNWNGRIGRKKYLVNFFKILLIVILLAIISIFLPTGSIYFVFIIMLFLVWVNTAKRLHDVNLSSWIGIFVILGAQFSITVGTVSLTISPIVFLTSLIGIPISIGKDVTMLFTLVSALIGLYLLFKKGTIGINKYGSDPLAIGADLSEDEKKKIAESYLQENSTPSANL